MKILFIVAHPDDESYGPYGTMIKQVREGHDVHVYSMCNGERPGSEHVSSGRRDGFKQNCDNAGVQWQVWDNGDLTLDLRSITDRITDLVNTEKPDVVYTHNISDLNTDHRLVAEACLVACRPKPSSTVNQLYFFEVPSSTDWTFGQVTPVFSPNTYVSLTADIVKLKQGALARYDTETYNYPDARSVEAMTTLLKYRGYQVGTEYAEAFSLVFSKT